MKVNIKSQSFTHRLYAHPKHPLRRAFLLVVFGLLVLGALAFAVVFAWYQQGLQPLSNEPRDILIEVEEGMGLEEIASRLEEEEVIRSSTVFTIYVTRSGNRGQMQTGLYEFSPDQHVREIREMLVEGEAAIRRVTVVEGASLIQIRGAMIEAGYSEEQVSEALERSYDHPMRQYAPDGASLEGYLYPDTYLADYSQAPDVLVELALDELENALTDDIIQGIQAQGLSVHEGIILASIIEREANSDLEEQRKIAQVFLRRLDQGMPLEADATACYAAERQGVREPNACQPIPIDITSPYNTRQAGNTGLTPGPIGSPTAMALEAVSNPANTDFLFFVHGDDGEAHFSRTNDEHERNVEEYCQERC